MQKGVQMVAVKGSDIKYNFKTICDKATNGETIIVSRPKNENIVIISEKKYQQFERLQSYFERLRNLKYVTDEEFKTLKGIAGVPLDLDEIRKERLNV